MKRDVYKRQPIGSASNLVVIEYLEQVSGREYMYIDWVVRFAPIMLTLLVTCTVYVFLISPKNATLAGSKEYLAKVREMCIRDSGMTGAQKAPTTPLYGKTKTSPYGNEEEPFDVGRLCIAAGATYFARWTTAHPVQLQKAICEAIQHKGFSVVEVISQCPTGAGRNMYGTDQGYEIMDMFKKPYTPLRPGEEPDITNTCLLYTSRCV